MVICYIPQIHIYSHYFTLVSLLQNVVVIWEQHIMSHTI